VTASTRRTPWDAMQWSVLAGGAVAALLVLVTAGQPLAKTAPPGVPGDPQEYAGAATCMSCHEIEGKSYRESPHGREWEPRGPASAQGCESCHGPGARHVEDPGIKGRIRNPLALSPREVADTCTTCHNREEHAQWQGSMHDSRNLSCISCHSVHTPKSEQAHLRAASIAETCSQCHRDKQAKLQRSAHMPVREGKMECTTCHNPHGSANVRLLRAGNSVTEFCASCHAEKRGPFLWEHPPVRESCVTCHDPHGASNDRMLVVRTPMLCQRCHIATRHPSTLYDNTAFVNQSNRVIARGCVNCHSSIHGSNHPAGMMFQR
jgi:DmsE family decaheme c-type cytochrome